jgi:hypothetical protein
MVNSKSAERTTLLVVLMPYSWQRACTISSLFIDNANTVMKSQCRSIDLNLWKSSHEHQ